MSVPPAFPPAGQPDGYPYQPPNVPGQMPPGAYPPAGQTVPPPGWTPPGAPAGQPVPPPGWTPPGATGGHYPPSQPAGTVHAPSPFALPADPAARQAQIFDFAIVGAAILAIIATFLPYYTLKLDAQNSLGMPGWIGGVSILGALLIMLAGEAYALIAFGLVVAARASVVRVAALAGFGAGWLLILISGFYTPSLGGLRDALGGILGMFGGGLKFGRGVGFWLTLVFATAALGVAVWLSLVSGRGNRPAVVGVSGPDTGVAGQVPLQPGFGVPPQASPFQTPDGFGVPPQAPGIYPPPGTYPGQPPIAPTT